MSIFDLLVHLVDVQRVWLARAQHTAAPPLDPAARATLAALREAWKIVDDANRFSWSSWRDQHDALEEIDTLLSELRSGILPSALTLHVLFAPTGPIQEVSLSSGWGDTFIELADRFDNAMANESIEAHANHELGPRETCTCFTLPSSHLIGVSDLGQDSQLAEVAMLICQDCGQYWLRYFYAVEAFTGSGRWYLGAITPDQIKALKPLGKVVVMALDLGDLASIHSFVTGFRQDYNRLDLLINNAGVALPPYGKTAQGFEQQFGINHLERYWSSSGGRCVFSWNAAYAIRSFLIFGRYPPI